MRQQRQDRLDVLVVERPEDERARAEIQRSGVTLVIKGPEDTYCPAMWALEIESLIPGSRYVEIPQGGHCCHISLPGAFNRALDGWLDELLRGNCE